MSEFKVSVSLDFIVEQKSPITKDELHTKEFVNQSLGEFIAYYATLANNPKYLGPKVRIAFPENPISKIESVAD